jgi:hypothetical protein
MTSTNVSDPEDHSESSMDAGEPPPAPPNDATQRRSVPPAVGPSNRNGYAAVVGRMLDRIAKSSPLGRGAAPVALSASDEAKLRDCDERQVGPVGATIAISGSKDEWRAFLRTHLERRFGVRAQFDAANDLK